MVLAGLVGVSGPGVAQSSEFRINTYTDGIQTQPRVTSFSDGGFVVVWQSSRSPGSDSNGRSILARRFDAAASPVGNDFQINQETTFDQISPLVATMAGDGFVVTWQTRDSSGTFESEGLKARIFDSSGSSIASEFRVEDPADGPISIQRAVGTVDSGRFAVVWTHQDGDDFFRVFDGQGAPLTAPVEVNPTGCSASPRLGTVADVDFVVLWTCSSGPLPVMYQRYAADGTPLGMELEGPSTQAVATTPTDFGFVLASFSSEGWSARRYDTAGVPFGSSFALDNGFRFKTLENGYVTLLIDNDGDRQGVTFSRVSTGGEIISRRMRANLFTADDQTNPDVVGLTDGRFVVVWDSRLSDDGDDLWSIRGRVFTDDLFEDGFESGDVSAWDLEVP